jgi:dephospho-CoA kinase
MKPTKKLLVVGIAGIMGAGKSTVARVFEELGARLIDADTMGKAMLKDCGIKDAVIAAFGDGIRDERGEIDTARLGRIAFESPENVHRLDALTREPLISRIKARIEELRASAEVIVIDAALLPEWDAKPWLDILIVVDSEEDRSAGRLGGEGRFKESDIRARMKHQFPRSKKAAYADVVVPNYGSLDDLKARARALFWTLRGIDTKESS